MLPRTDTNEYSHNLYAASSERKTGNFQQILICIVHKMKQHGRDITYLNKIIRSTLIQAC